MNLILITGPTAEPVTIEELRLQRRLPESHDEDNELARYISAARGLEGPPGKDMHYK